MTTAASRAVVNEHRDQKDVVRPKYASGPSGATIGQRPNPAGTSSNVPISIRRLWVWGVARHFNAAPIKAGNTMTVENGTLRDQQKHPAREHQSVEVI
jgi:hypothetical protein